MVSAAHHYSHASSTTGSHGLAIAFYQSDGITPLLDTDGDGVPDTGTMATGAKVDVVATVTVPGNVNPGDSERSLLTFTSSNDVTKLKTARAITTVPPPGVSIGPRAYLPLQPGDVAQVPMTARNTGGFPDTVELAASSNHGWTVTLLDAATLPPLQDSDRDGLVDTGAIPGLTATAIVAEIQVPANAPLEIVDRTDVTASSHADPLATAVSSVVIELLGPPSPEWPQFHHDRERGGINPVPFEMDLTRRWTASPGGFEERWTAPVVSGHTVFFEEIEGNLVAADLGTGASEWPASAGAPGWVTGTPAGASGLVYAAFVTNFASSVSIFAVDEATGALVWRADANVGFTFRASTTIAVAAGNVYWYDFLGNSVHANDALTGAPLWTYTMAATVYQGPAYWAGMVYAADGAGNVLALDAFTGSLIWQTTLPSNVVAAPAVAGGVVYVGNGTVFLSTWDGNLYAWEASTGTLLQQLPLAPQGSSSSVALADGYLVVGDQAGGIDGFSFVGAGVAATVSVSPPTADVAVTSGVVLLGQAEDLYGNAVGGASFSWSSTNGLGTVLPVSPSGDRAIYIAGTVEGADTAVAMSGSVSGAATIHVLPGALDHVDVIPGVASVVAGGQLTFGAGARDRYGNPIPGATFTWSVTGGIGTITATAVFTAGYAAGSGALSVASGGRTVVVTVTVVPGAVNRIDVSPGSATVAAGGTLTFTGTPRDLFGNAISGLALSWSASSSLGTITSTGVLTAATAVGTGTVTVTAGSASATIPVTIVPGAPAQIVVSPTSLTVSAGSTSTLVASLQDTNGNVISAGTLSWSGGQILPLSSDGRIAQFSAPTTTGTHTLTVSQGGVSSTVGVTIVAGPASAIAISGSGSVAAGATTTFTASTTDAYGNAVSGATVSWSASRGTITAAGALTAPTVAGSLVVIASAAGRQASLTVDVSAGALDHLAPSATTVNLLTGGGTLLTVTGVDAYDNEGSGGTDPGATTIRSVTPAADRESAAFSAGGFRGARAITISAGGKTTTIAVSVAESSLPIARQATTTTSLVFLVVAILAIAASILMLGRARAARRELDEMRKGGAPPPP